MFENKYGKFLTILLIIVIVLIVAIGIFFIYEMVTKSKIDGDAQDAVSQFEQNVIQNTTQENTIANETGGGDVVDPIIGGGNTQQGGNSSNTNKPNMYKGFRMAGTLKIPKISIEYPVLEDISKKAIEVAVAIIDGPGLNQVGNTTIIGHNYRNGTFFSNNNKLALGDKIYITDTSGKKVEYTIYNKYTTTAEDAEYMRRDTQGKREISLTTCTDSVKARLVIWAKED